MHQNRCRWNPGQSKTKYSAGCKLYKRNRMITWGSDRQFHCTTPQPLAALGADVNHASCSLRQSPGRVDGHLPRCGRSSRISYNHRCGFSTKILGSDAYKPRKILVGHEWRDKQGENTLTRQRKCSLFPDGLCSAGVRIGQLASNTKTKQTAGRSRPGWCQILVGDQRNEWMNEWMKEKKEGKIERKM